MKKRAVPFVFVLCCIFLSLTFASASSPKVAYIYKKDYKIDQNFITLFEDMGLEVELIKENTGVDWNDYKLIFVGDELLSNPSSIPIGNYPSIVSNSYHGITWGLVDDAISQLGGNAPLNVRTSTGHIRQAYTQAYYKSKIAIPYAYLRNTTAHNDMAPGLNKVVSTYQGNGYDLGAVIAYGDIGGQLHNRILHAELCFFGINDKTSPFPSSTSHWTSASKNLFEECVEHVAIECSEDSDCGTPDNSSEYCQNNSLYQDKISYTCEEPGTVLSKCVENTEQELLDICEDICENNECVDVLCYTNSDCGFNGLGEEYCLNENVYQDFISYTCNNPGTGQSSCSNTSTPTLIETCEDTCLNGGCIDFDCEIDTDCSDDYYANPYCSNNNSYIDFHNFSCEQNLCVENIEHELVEACAEECLDGICQDIECSTHTDCGINGFTGPFYCLNENSYQDFISYTCNNPGTNESSCSDFTLPILNEYCNFCLSGECITCFNSLSCGNDSFIGEKYCISEGDMNCTRADIDENGVVDDLDYDIWNQEYNPIGNPPCTTLNLWCDGADIDENGRVDGADLALWQQEYGKTCTSHHVYQDFVEFTCSNPGTPNSDCESTSIPTLIETCEDICINGECRDIACSSDIECDDINPYTYDQCINPNTASSYCLNTPINCISDADCGTTGFFGIEYCSNNNVYKNFRNSTCLNPSTPLSACSVISNPILISDCGNGTCVENGIAHCESITEPETFHDIALSDLKIKTSSGGSVNPLALASGNDYKIYIDVENIGNYSENVSFEGFVNEISFSHQSVVNLLPGEKKNDKVRTINFNLPEGNYELNVTALPLDSNPLDNFVSMLISVFEPECEIDSDCPDTVCEEDGCTGNDYYEYTSDINECVGGICEDNPCIENIIPNDIRCTTPDCENGEDRCEGTDYIICISETWNNIGKVMGECGVICLQSSDCGQNSLIGELFCQGDNVYQDFLVYSCTDYICSNNTAPILQESCSETCYGGECVECNDDSDCNEGEICENHECIDDCIDYSSGELCLDTGYNSENKLSDYVTSWTPAVTSCQVIHGTGENQCGYEGFYYVGSACGASHLEVKTPHLPKTGEYILRLEYGIGTPGQYNENFVITCGDDVYEISDPVEHEANDYYEVELLCEFDEGENTFEIEGNQDSVHFDVYEIIGTCPQEESYDSGWLCLDAYENAWPKTCSSSGKVLCSDYVVDYNAYNDLWNGLMQRCGAYGSYTIGYLNRRSIDVQTPSLPEEGEYLIKFEAGIGSYHDYNMGIYPNSDENFRVLCNNVEAFVFEDDNSLYKQEAWYPFSFTCNLDEGNNIIRFESTTLNTESSVHLDRIKITQS